jgi:serpin B
MVWTKEAGMQRGLMATFLAMAAVMAGCDEDRNTALTRSAVESERHLAFALHSQFRQAGGNMVFSPHGVALVLGMSYLGARGATEAEMSSALEFALPQADFHASMSALDAALRSRGDGLPTGAFHLHSACGAWADLAYPVLPDYASGLSDHYGAELVSLDFAGDPDASRDTINQWIDTETGGRVPELLPPGALDSGTVFVLGSAVTFQAEWLYQFGDPSYTGDVDFTLIGGATIQVPTMYGEMAGAYGEGPGWKALELPYVGEQVSMVLLLPDAGTFDAFESALTAAVFDAAVATLGPTETVNVLLPRFSFSSEHNLIPALGAMGMTGAFAPGADFSGIDGSADGAPWIGFVRQKATISVDEYGTEAAAGTTMGGTIGVYPFFDAQRPFIFAVRDKATGAIFFMGRVVDPSA